MISKELNIKKGVTSIIGGGGKTSLIVLLAEELKINGHVVIATTTHMLRPVNYPLAQSLDELKVLMKNNRIVVVGRLCNDNKITIPSFEEWKNMGDYIIVEADGSRHLPIKAHRDSEPVIIEESNQTILVIGNHGFGKTIREAVHNPEIYAEISNCSLDDLVTEENLKELLIKENNFDKIVINCIFEKRQYIDKTFENAVKCKVFLENIDIRAI